MNVLAIDTSTSVCVVGLSVKGRVTQRTEDGVKNHANLVLGFVEDLLQEQQINLSELDRIVLGRGPGSFTGLRIAATVVQGLAISQQLPIVTVSTLQAMAQGMFRQFNKQAVGVVQDARMDEVYFGLYRVKPEENLMTADSDESVLPLDDIDLTLSPYYFVGSGLRSEPDKNILYPFAEDLTQLGINQTPQSPEMALPTYIRNQVTHQRSYNG